MIRKILLFMLMLVVMAQGVNAESWTVSQDVNIHHVNWSGSSYGPYTELYIPNDYVGQTMYYSTYATAITNTYTSDLQEWSAMYITGLTLFGAEVSSANTLDTKSYSGSKTIVTDTRLAVRYWYYSQSEVPVYDATFTAVVTASTSSPNSASGESCNSNGTFIFYQNNTYYGSDSFDGNYSFSIFDGINYQIHLIDTNISEWHNFTADGDEEWNPTDTCNNADFNFTNLSYTSPVKQYLTSTVTVDINDTDGTISSAIARIDGSNYSMQFIGGEKWRYLFTGTNIIKNYYITNIYATDNEGGQDSESYNASYIHVESRTGGGGGGGGGSYPSDPTIPPSEPCTLNCDTDGDGTCDLNCDDNDDGTCDRNCDTDDDGTCDLNCDDNDDGTCDRNCDTDDDGTCDLNCDDNNDGTCDRNCDTDGDGYCDVNCDDSANRPRDEDIPDDFKDLFENILDGDIPDDFWTDKNLRIHPASLNSTAFYTGWDKPQNITYRFLTNKFIDSCEVTNGTCTIDQRFLVNFNTIINENTTGYRGTLTVSRTGETAIADIYINVINLCACKEITPWQLNISDEWAQKLVYFVRVKDGAIVCIRWWAMIALLIILLGIVLYDSNKR